MSESENPIYTLSTWLKKKDIIDLAVLKEITE